MPSMPLVEGFSEKYMLLACLSIEAAVSCRVRTPEDYDVVHMGRSKSLVLVFQETSPTVAFQVNIHACCTMDDGTFKTCKNRTSKVGHKKQDLGG
jgi:hypothetical protein